MAQISARAVLSNISRWDITNNLPRPTKLPLETLPKVSQKVPGSVTVGDSTQEYRMLRAISRVATGVNFSETPERLLVEIETCGSPHVIEIYPGGWKWVS